MSFPDIVFKVRFGKSCRIANKLEELADQRQLVLTIILFNGDSLCKAVNYSLTYLFCESGSCLLDKNSE